MEDFISLKLLDRISFIYKASGVNYDLMRLILKVKFLMDGRRVPTVMQNNKVTDGGNNFKKSLISYGIMGLIILSMLFVPFPLFYSFNLIFGILIFMIMTVMISDFSGVLLDIKEKNILLPRPVDNRTMNAAKVTHILIYLSIITMTMSAPVLVGIFIKYGALAGLVFLLELILMTGFVLFLTSMLYFLVLKFFDGEKLKDIINYFQIILAIVMIVGYQLVGRIFSIIDFTMVFTPRWWHYLLPSAWFSAPFMLIAEKSRESYFIIQSLMAAFVPVVMFVLYIRLIIPHFEKNLQKLNSSSEGKEKSIERKLIRRRRMAGLLCRDNTENIFYRFASRIISKERKLKLKLYPSLAFALVMPLIFIFNALQSTRSLSNFKEVILSGRYYQYLYVSIMILSSGLWLLKFSERYKGAWVYRVLPIGKPTPVFRGALKAFAVKYIFPVYLFGAVVFTSIYGIGIIPEIIVIFLNMILLITVIFKVRDKELPFCRDFENTDSGGFVILMLSLVFCGICYGLLQAAGNIRFGIEAYILINIVVNIVMWRIVVVGEWKDVS